MPCDDRGDWIGCSSHPRAGEFRSWLKRDYAVFVVVDLNDDARKMGLNQGVIEADVKLKLRLARMRAVTAAEILTMPGSPLLYVNVSTLAPQAATVQVQLDQNAHLERNEELAAGVTTWDATVVVANPSAQGIRDTIKREIDNFLKVVATESIRRRNEPSGRGSEPSTRPLPRRSLQARAQNHLSSLGS
jgi:hypothetical protein